MVRPPSAFLLDYSKFEHASFFLSNLVLTLILVFSYKQINKALDFILVFSHKQIIKALDVKFS